MVSQVCEIFALHFIIFRFQVVRDQDDRMPVFDTARESKQYASP